MSRTTVHVLSPGKEQLVRQMLDSPHARAQGWIFRGARMHDREIQAAYQHRVAAAVVTFSLVHPSVARDPAARTEHFAIVPRAGKKRGEAHELAGWIAESVKSAELASLWHTIDGDESDLAGEPAARECLEACTPALQRFLAAFDAEDPVAVEARSAELFAELSQPRPVPTAVLIGAHVLGALGRPGPALQWIGERLETVDGPGRDALLGEMFESAARIGFRDEALKALDARIEASRDDAALLDAAAGFYGERHDHDRAVQLAREASSRDPALAVHAAEIFAAAGHEPEAREAAARAAHAGDPATILRAARALREAGDFDGEERLLQIALANEGTRLPALVRLAQLALWRGDHEAGARHAGGAAALSPGDPAVLRYRGAASLFGGDPGRAIADLDASASIDPADVETMTLRAEALWRLGKRDEAQAILGEAQLRAGTFTPLDILANVLRAEAGEYGGSYAPFVDDCVARLPVSTAVLDRLGFTTAPHHETPAQTLGRWLALLRGNRSTTLTTSLETAGLQQVRPRDDARTDSRLTQALLQTRSPDEVLARFDGVLERHPDKPYPLCYRGELLLWLGRYDAARADFLAAIAMRRDTRWAYVGLGAVELFQGEPARALATLERGIEIAKGAGPTTFAYRGEAYRLLGQHSRAVDDLSHACREMPLRVGAWVNLALVLGAQGKRDELAEIFDRLRGIATGLFAEACAESQVDALRATSFEDRRQVLEHARTMLRGNRSSTLGTWFNGAGQLRAMTWGRPDPRIDHLGWLRSAMRRE